MIKVTHMLFDNLTKMLIIFPCCTSQNGFPVVIWFRGCYLHFPEERGREREKAREDKVCCIMHTYCILYSSCIPHSLCAVLCCGNWLHIDCTLLYLLIYYFKGSTVFSNTCFLLIGCIETFMNYKVGYWKFIYKEATNKTQVCFFFRQNTH